jgi:glycosyltransferase involved in cell wall biosynthesis
MLDDWSMSQKPWKKKLFMSMSGRQFLQSARRIHCTAEGELSQAKKWIGDSETAVLPCLTDLNPFEKLPGPESALSLLAPAHRGDLKMLFLSRIHEKKGIDILIRAAALMRDAGMKFIVMIAGTGDPFYKDELYRLVAELNLRDRVFFLGLVTGMQKISVYQSADLFVLPTAQENFGLVLTEALACGTPVLTTNGTDIWPEVQAAGGEITDRTPEAIAAAATKLLNDPADRKARGIRGREWIFSNLAVETVSKRYEALYREMMNDE